MLSSSLYLHSLALPSPGELSSLNSLSLANKQKVFETVQQGKPLAVLINIYI
jgi:hypothetical protein